jgi:hypothetical protein
MKKIVAEILLLSAVLMSCSGGGKADTSPLMKTVPSRAVAVMHFGDCNRALNLLLDSAHVFRSIDYGRLSSSEVILSYDYAAALVPLLCIDAGRATPDTSAAVLKILEQAEKKHLCCEYTADLMAKRAVLLLSPSRALISEAMSHINSGSSILDVQGFPAAEALSDGSCGSIFLKNESASRLLPPKMLKDYFARKDLVRFFSGAAEWTVLDFSAYSRKGIEVRCWGDGRQKYLCEMFSSLNACRCEAAGVIPSGADFVLGLPMRDPAAYLSSWQSCLDMRASLSKYKGKLAAMKKTAGKKPETWFMEQYPREIVLVRWDGREVLLLRPAKRPAASAPAGNPYQGFVPALIGEAFRIQDDSFVASDGGWLAYGSEENIAAWLEAEKGPFRGLPGKAKYYFVNKEFGIAAGPENTVLDVN